MATRPFAVVVMVAVAVGAVASTPLRAQVPPAGGRPRGGQGAQEEKRRKLLEEIGLEKRKAAPPAAPAPAPAPPPSDVAPERAGSDADTRPDEAAAGKATPPPSIPAAPSFRRTIHPLLLAACGACHRAGGPAAATRLILSGDAVTDHAAAVRVVAVRDAAASALLAKVSGQPHVGGSPWPRESPAYGRVLAWIARGARLDAAADTPVAATPRPDGPRAAAKNAEAPTPAPRPVSAAPPLPASPQVPVAAPPATAAATTMVAPAAAPQIAVPPAAGVAAPFAAVHPILMNACSACHRAGAPASMTRLVLSGDAVPDEAAARALVQPATPERSPLLTKASGVLHGGGVIFSEGDPRHTALLAWAAAPRVPPEPAAPIPEPAPGSPAAPSPSAVASMPAAPGPAPARAGGVEARSEKGVALPFGILLNGRFDLDYERRDFTGNPFASRGVNALRSYHHFLFLSRERLDDPCGLSVEIVALTFWEAHCRVARDAWPVALTVAGGKIVVPFGADPLFHQSYGGLAGFDQRVLPPIWAEEGVAAHGVYQRGDVVVTDDLFVIRGYALGRADGVLNLQNDFSAADHARLGWGNRLGAAWKVLSAWYSAYFNPLGFGRHLFMQAIDVTVYRPRDVPVLGHFSFGGGLLRADVSGGDAPGVGGVGHDYYHFASYFQVRYHPNDWLYVQYRQGLRTFDNRRGLILDNSRLTSADSSTHNFAVVGRYRGLSAGLAYFINLEKVDEIPDDLLRANVTYEF